jgi:RimJ/RimL family protein N-acetyltransferase
MPVLETERLTIRPFVEDDLTDIHRILDVELSDADFGSEGAKALAERETWLRWTILNDEQLAKLYQPPYGDRAIVLKPAGLLVGACGYVPCLNAFGQLPSAAQPTRLASAELGLFYAISPLHQRRGYAAEAARALAGYAFKTLKLRRIVATTTYDNAGSMGVMRKLGMRVEKNPYPDPPWLQVVGVLDSPYSDGDTLYGE